MRFRATRIIIDFSIILILLVILVRSFGGLSMLKAMGKQASYFMRLRIKRIEISIADVLFGLENEGAMVLEAASIHLTDPGQKIEG